jgi:hypothetical protein
MPREILQAERCSLNVEAIALQDAVSRLRFCIDIGYIPPAAMDRLYNSFAAFALHAEGMMTDVDRQDVRALAVAATNGFLTRLDRVFDPPAADDGGADGAGPFVPDGASWTP